MRKLHLSELNRMSVEEFKSSAKIPIIIVLDNVRSLHNIGSVFRTSDAFRLEALYLCGITGTPPNKEIRKTALGSTESVNWKYFDHTEAAIDLLRKNNYSVFAVEQVEGSMNLDEFVAPISGKLGLVFGNEVKGVEEKLLPLLNGCIEIPQFGTKHSLNIAVTVGIVIWELFKKFYKG